MKKASSDRLSGSNWDTEQCDREASADEKRLLNRPDAMSARKTVIAYRTSESEEAQALIAGGLDNIRWDLLSDAARGPKVWAALARKIGPQALRMNLNTLLRHDVFHVAASLRDA